MESVREGCPIARALLHTLSKSPVYEPPSRFQVLLCCKWAPMVIAVTKSYITYLPGSPVKEPPPLEAVSLSLFRVSYSISGAPFILLSKPIVDEPSNRFTNEAPMKRDACFQVLFYISFRVPSKGALPPGSLHRASTDCETVHLQSPFQPSPKVPRRRALMKRDAHPHSHPFITFRAPSKGAPLAGSPNRSPIQIDPP